MRLISAGIIASIVALLFPFGYWICLYTYPDDTIRFFDLRMNLVACFMFCSFLYCKILTQPKWLNFILDIGLGMSASDILDRFYFDVTKFQDSDLIMIASTFLFASIDYHRKKLYNLICRLLKLKH